MRINDNLASKSAQNPTIFNFNNSDLRVYEKDGNPWFVAVDIAAIFGIANIRSRLKMLDDDEKGVALTYTLGGEQEVSTVNESGMWTLVLRSKAALQKGTPAYKARKWVTNEVLPSIRKNGMYIKPGMILHSKFPHINFEPMPEGSVCFTPDEVNLIRTAVYYHSYLFKDCHKATYDILEKVHSPLSAKYWEMLHTTTFWQLEDILNKRGYPMKEFDCYRHFKGLLPLTKKNKYLK